LAMSKLRNLMLVVVVGGRLSSVCCVTTEVNVC
jgi:hypothetical protein